MKGEKPLSLGPLPEEKTIGMYMNRNNEISWIILRTLPFLQLEPRAFGKEWARKWHVLDDSFGITIEELGNINKKIAWAVIALVDRKFRFTPEETYF